MHPATCLALWAGVLILMQQQGLPLLALFTGLALALACVLARKRCWLILRRTRWLLLTTALLLVWGTPGEYLTMLPGVSVEGLTLAAHQILCLLLFLACLSLLLEWLGTPRLIAALYALMMPLRVVGLDRNKAALRLLLVMDYLEQPPPARGWREWLRQDEDQLDCTGFAAITLPQAEFTWRDAALLLVALAWVICV